MKNAICTAKGWNPANVTIDEANQTVTNGRSVYGYETTPKGRLIASSIRFLWTVSDFNNCTY